MAANGTPWFKVFSQFRTHPKIKRLARELGISRPEAAGHMVFLWCWATDFYPDGRLPHDDDEIADEAGASAHAPDAFVQAMVGAELLDDEDDAYCIHNFGLYSELYKRAESQRKRRREKRSTRDAAREASQKPVRSQTEASLKPREEKRQKKNDEGIKAREARLKPVSLASDPEPPVPGLDEPAPPRLEPFPVAVDLDALGDEGRLTMPQAEALGFEKLGSIGGGARARLTRFFPIAVWEWRDIAKSDAFSWGYAEKMLAGFRRELSAPREPSPGGRPSTARNGSAGIVDVDRVLEGWAYAEDRADSKG